jgi:hypothetical protein
MTSSAARVILVAIGALMVIGALGAIAVTQVSTAASVLPLLVGGGVLIVAGLLERTRYRSDAAERTNEPSGPGGGETSGKVEARFQRTDETFVDPTTRVRMRVLVDARTGERRYVAEGDG